MANFTPLLVVGWVLVVLGLFPALRRPRAVLAALLAGLLLLPEVGSAGAAAAGVAPLGLGPLHFTKDLTVSYALLFAVLLYDWKRLLAGRPRWFDIPMLVWCLCPLASALTNDPPPDGSWDVRDGLSQALQQTITWGVPYLVGRLYFTDARAFRDLAAGTVLAAAVYAPLCLVEVRLSPQLHRTVYGFSQHSFLQTMRFGGYRPMVFFKHGLTLSLWMVTASLVGAWVCMAKAEPGGKSRPGTYLVWLLFLLVPTAVLLKSAGALALGLAGLGVLCVGRLLPSRAWLLLLAAVIPAYVLVRASGAWGGEDLVEAVKAGVGEDRAQSLQFRLENEDRLVKQALKRPLFGWGGWGRARVYDEEGNDLSVTDGLWIIALGDRGFVGLAALGGVMVLPVLRFAFRVPARNWSDEWFAAVTACAVVVVLWGIDALMNAGFNHLYPLMAGAVAGLDPKRFATEVKAPARRAGRVVRRVPPPLATPYPRCV